MRIATAFHISWKMKMYLFIARYSKKIAGQHIVPLDVKYLSYPRGRIYISKLHIEGRQIT